MWSRPKLNMRNCRLHTYGTLEMAEVPRLPNVISATPNELMTTPQGEERQTLRHVVHMVRLLFFRILVPAFCGTVHPPGGARPGTYEKQTSRQTGHPDINCLIFAHTPPPLFHLPASSRITAEAMHAFPPNPNRRVPAHSWTPEIGVVSTMSPRRKGIICCLPRWECSPESSRRCRPSSTRDCAERWAHRSARRWCHSPWDWQPQRLRHCCSDRTRWYLSRRSTAPGGCGSPGSSA